MNRNIIEEEIITHIENSKKNNFRIEFNSKKGEVIRIDCEIDDENELTFLVDCDLIECEENVTLEELVDIVKKNISNVSEIEIKGK